MTFALEHPALGRGDAGSRVPFRWPLPAVVVALAAGYATLYLAVTLVTAFGGSSGTTFWPAAGVTVAVLLRRERREWPWLLAGVWLVEFILDLTVSDVSWAVSGGWATANCVEPLLAASLLTWQRPKELRKPSLANADDLIRFVGFAVIAGPTLGALVGVGSGALTGFYGFWPAFPRWFVGDAVGALVVAPVLLLDARDLTRTNVSVRHITSWAAVLGLGALAIMGPWHAAWGTAIPYLLVPLIALAALRVHFPGAAVGIAVVAFIVEGMTAAHYGPFAIDDEIAGLINAQSFLAMSAFAAFLVAALTSDAIGRDEADRAKNALLQTVAHDLRGPLGVISGMAETLQLQGSRMDDEQRAALISRIGSTASRLSKMATGILDLNRVEGALERVPTDLIALARRLLVQIEPEDHPITLDPHPAHAAVDPVEVERIIENLVANAVRHTPRGTTIWARFAETADGIILTVEDEGPGVPDAQKETIFRAFQRGHSPRPGTGVGLAVVERFARNHGGRAWVEDRVGSGASFHVFLAT